MGHNQQITFALPGIILMMADAVTAALNAQETPNGYYNISRMLKLVLNHQGHCQTLRQLCSSKRLGRAYAARGC